MRVWFFVYVNWIAFIRWAEFDSCEWYEHLEENEIVCDDNTVYIVSADGDDGKKYDCGKVRMDLVPLDVVENIGKGGVGKSMVTSLLAAASMREGFKTAILD